MQNIVDINKFIIELEKAKCNFRDHDEKLRFGHTIETISKIMSQCLVKDQSFYRLETETISKIMDDLKNQALEGLNENSNWMLRLISNNVNKLQDFKKALEKFDAHPMTKHIITEIYGELESIKLRLKEVNSCWKQGRRFDMGEWRAGHYMIDPHEFLLIPIAEIKSLENQTQMLHDIVRQFREYYAYWEEKGWEDRT